jgi:hypothetical protein
MTEDKPMITMDDEGMALIEAHRRWWQREGSLLTREQGTPLGDLYLPLADGTVATQDMDLTPDMLDVERLAGPCQEPGPLRIRGDRFDIVTAFTRVPWVEAVLGVPIHATLQGGSMRGKVFVESWEDWRGVAAHRDAEWYDLLLQLTEMLVARSGGRHAVVAPIMRGPSDLAEAVLGAELMCLSIYDRPHALRSFLEESTDLFIEILHALLARFAPVAGGYVSPFGIWAPGTVVRTQCDASAILSPRHYAEEFLPYDVLISESVDYSIIHLHSSSLHTVAALLEVERPQAIQVTLETGTSVPPLTALVPIFRKILEVKPLLIEGQLTEAEVKWLVDTLPAEGLGITAREAAW